MTDDQLLVLAAKDFFVRTMGYALVNLSLEVWEIMVQARFEQMDEAILPQLRDIYGELK